MKNWYWYAVAAVALGLAFVFQSPYMAYAIYTFLLLVVLANLSSLAWLAGLDCTRTLDKQTVQQGEDVNVEVTVHNRRGWPIPWIVLEDYRHAPTGEQVQGLPNALPVVENRNEERELNTSSPKWPARVAHSYGQS